jgi:hypothetical protein
VLPSPAAKLEVSVFDVEVGPVGPTGDVVDARIVLLVDSGTLIARSACSSQAPSDLLSDGTVRVARRAIGSPRRTVARSVARIASTAPADCAAVLARLRTRKEAYLEGPRDRGRSWSRPQPRGKTAHRASQGKESQSSWAFSARPERFESPRRRLISPRRPRARPQFGRDRRALSPGARREPRKSPDPGQHMRSEPDRISEPGALRRADS